MDVVEFAERVVFSTNLADKLSPPSDVDAFEERQVSQVVNLIDAPGRPAELRIESDSTAASIPTIADLDKSENRGKLLHFLANHELLATELMALVLLKFPDAPEAFRRGVLETLVEEQRHTRMYIRRMSECGVEFGSFPLSGHFWRVVAPMLSPLDFVSKLSLTFEQANLDYSLYFANVFEQIGDVKTTRILKKIYRDEIGHVSHGLKWFREWKDPATTDWQAFQATFQFPMSPQRARGPLDAFNREGRLLAGLSSELIDQVEVYRQSRGRTPTVRWFDPSAEAAFGQLLSTQDQRMLSQLESDLEYVMVTQCRPDDVMLVRNSPSIELRKHWQDAHLVLPEFVRFESRSALSDRKIHDFQPWAWTPASHALADEFEQAVQLPPTSWNPKHERFFYKSFAAEQLRTWLDDSAPDWFASPDVVGRQVRSMDGIRSILAELAERGFSRALFKLDLGASGRGQRRLSCDGPLDEHDAQWCEAMLRKGNGVVEAALDRQTDVSFVWRSAGNTSGGVEPQFVGWTRPLITPSRRYAGTRLGQPFVDCDRELTKFLLADNYARLHLVKDWLVTRLGPLLKDAQFTGNFGVDTLVYRDKEGGFRWKPIVEFNPRLTMGHVAIRLEKVIAPGTYGEFRILSRSEWAALDPRSEEFSIQVGRDGRLKSGLVRFFETTKEGRLFPVLVVGKAATAQLPQAI